MDWIHMTFFRRTVTVVKDTEVSSKPVASILGSSKMLTPSPRYFP